MESKNHMLCKKETFERKLYLGLTGMVEMKLRNIVHNFKRDFQVRTNLCIDKSRQSS
jgi:hypothetical protein